MRHFLRGAPWLMVSLAFLLTSCALTALVPLIPVAHKVPFDESQFVRYRGSGSSGVAGQVVVTGPDGAVHLGAQDHVSLIPVNAYTTELINRSIGDGETLSSDARFHQYVRLTKADDQGNFQFSHNPAGEYYVACLASWADASDFYYQWACERVTVSSGQTARLKVSHNLHNPNRDTLEVWALR